MKGEPTEPLVLMVIALTVFLYKESNYWPLYIFKHFFQHSITMSVMLNSVVQLRFPSYEAITFTIITK